MPSFSQRNRYAKPPEIGVREELPQKLRQPIAHIAARQLGSKTLIQIVKAVLDPYGLDPQPQVAGWAVFVGNGDADLIVATEMLNQCPWFRVYDVIEAIHRHLVRQDQQGGIPVEGVPHAPAFEREINRYFVNAGIGWQLVNGEIVTRGSEAFERTMEVVGQELAERPTTEARIREAINDLSRRPQPDFSGAVSHAFAAMECIIGNIKYTPEEIRLDTRNTFGSFLQRHPDLFPSDDLKEGFQRLWKYANNEGSRHGKEGLEPARDEAELIVSLAATLVTYLNRKHPK